MGAFSFSEVNDDEVGRAHAVDHKGYRRVRGTLTGPASYDSGGSALPVLEFKEVFELHVVADEGVTPSASGRQLELVAGVPGSVKVYDNTDTEEADATDVSASSWVVEVIGR